MLTRFVHALIPIIFVATVFSSCNAPKKPADTQAAVPEEKGLSVEIQQVAPDSISRKLTTSGILEGWDDITLSAEINGKLQDIFIDEGQSVKKGQIILSLEHDSLAHQLAAAEAGLKSAEQNLKKIENGVRPEEMAQIEAQLESARVNYENAQSNFESIQALYKEGVVAKVDLDAAESRLAGARTAYETALKSKELAQLGARDEDRESVKESVKSARAQRDIAKSMYDKAFFPSPIDGMVAFIFGDRNEMVGAGTPLINIVSVDKLKLPVAFSAKEAHEIKIGLPVKIFPEALEDSEFTGTLKQIDIKADPRTGTFGAQIEVLNPDGKILPGMTARVEIAYAEKSDVIVIPFDSIINRGLEKYVFVAEGTRATIKRVEIGIIDGNRVEILEGITPGMNLIVAGHKELMDGDLLDIRGGE